MEANIILGLIALFGLTLVVGKKQSSKKTQKHSHK